MLEPAWAHLRGGRWSEAQAAFRQALAQDAGSVPARMGLARAASASGDWLTAAAWLSDACRLVPRDREPAVSLGELLIAQRQFGQAVAVYRRLYDDLDDRDRATLLHLGYSLEQTFELDEAIERYTEAAMREPGFLEAHVNLAGVLWRVGRFDDALAHARTAVQLGPNHPHAVRMLGMALLNLNRVDEAELQSRRALSLAPDLAAAQFDLASCLLLAGRLDEGWEWYGKRWNDPARLRRPPFYDAALEWRGPSQSLQGQSVVVYAEQGMGDAIQLLRYVPKLQRLGARVVCAVHTALVPLVEYSFGVECLTPERGTQVDLHAALLDLPLRFRTTLDDVPSPGAYLQAPPQHVAKWRHRIAPSPKLKVGLAWSGWTRQVNNRNRAIALSELQPLLDLEGVQWFSLQKGDAGSFTDTETSKLVDLTGEWNDFADSAAMLGELDLVITVDTVVAHLAGAVGRECWVMLPPNPDFRWLLDRDDSPWYASLRLFRRGFEADGRARQVAAVRDALAARVARAT
ncbi:tetratricopeptide repeat protein [Ramlibacter humi]|uniref:Tetratricopeptide repeat protein n=1 Tax=Ramlibacter humi TaxID=2530451 RepID=A0A4Z0CEX9_9BURK|nr:tetratricopeptide repeat protein [Ramlibacter humi]TFZ08979.1 tetratricopeptide repeat protein [Ramlibacter humi]